MPLANNNAQSLKQPQRGARLETMVTSFKQLLETPFSSVINIILIAIAISIPMVLKLSVDNFKQWAGYNNNGLEISAYLKSGTVDNAALSLTRRISDWPGVESADYISKQAALDELKAFDELEQALEQLDENPLPASIRIRLPHSHDIQELAESIVEKTRQQPEIQFVRFDTEWFNKAAAIINTGQQIYSFITGFLSFGVLLVIGNAVRMTIDNHKEEILVSKLVGATDGYVRKPFIFMGMWIGALGAAAGLSLCFAGCWYLNQNLDALQLAYASDISLVLLKPLYVVGVIICCALLGLLGAWLMCNSHLNRIAPE